MDTRQSFYLARGRDDLAEPAPAASRLVSDRITIGGDHDDRDIWPEGFGFRQEFKTAHARHIDVRHDHDERHARRVADALKRNWTGLNKLHSEPPGAEVMAEALAKQHLDIGFIVDHENK